MRPATNGSPGVALSQVAGDKYRKGQLVVVEGKLKYIKELFCQTILK